MALPPGLDHGKLSEAALALLGLTAHTEHGTTRAWKGMDWDLLDAFLAPRRRRCLGVVQDTGAAVSVED